MRPEHRELHVHLGVDNVFENLFERLFEEGALNESNTKIWYVTADLYRESLRDAVDSASIPIVTFLEDAFDRDLLISRPRMLFPGSPLNCGTEIRRLTYKVEHIQHIFSGRRILFHLFLTDHISYLYQHQKYVSSNPKQVFNASWQPLIEAVASKILDKNELQIWNADEPAQFLNMVLEDILRVPETELDKLLDHAKSIPGKTPSPAELTAFRSKFRLKKEFFDGSYEEELSQLKQCTIWK